MLVADAHPRYRSTAWAQRNAAGRPVRRVQHHHAHIAAVMAEHGLDGSVPVLGFAFDGTGYGPDGAVWGGEVLLADYKGYQRLAQLQLRPAGRRRRQRVRARTGWRWRICGPPGCRGTTIWRPCGHARPTNGRCCATNSRPGLGCAPTSSMGRLFDAVSALAGVRQVVDYEAQAAIELEGLARDSDPGGTGYRFAVDSTGPTALIDPAPVLGAVVADVRAGVTAGVIGAGFHRAVAALIVGLAAANPGHTVALSGGVFQNALLLRTTPHTAGRQRIRRDHPPPGAAQRRRHRAGTTAGRATRDLKGDRPMCLAVPGRIVSIEDRDGTLMSVVDFGGVRKDVCLQYIPDAEVGEYVVVHVGFAIQRLDEESAMRTLAEFEHLGVLDEEFGDGFEIAARQAGGRRPRTQRVGGDLMKYLDEFSDPDLARQADRPDQGGHHPALGDHGSLWRPDTFDHPARHRPAAARHRSR